jgi:tellurite resistance protein TerA
MGIDYTKKPSAPVAAPDTAAAPVSYTKQAAATPSAAPPVSLSKVTLTKGAPAVSLTKGGGKGGTMRVNLNWTARPDSPAGQPPAPKGFMKKLQAAAEQRMSSGAIDLDLGCLYEYSDGSKGVVQALGNAFRDKHNLGQNPICWLDGDDRSGAATGGENLFIDLSRESSIKRILVFAFIYQGVPNWAGADAVVTLFPTDGPPVEIRLDEADNKAPMCAIALLTDNGAGAGMAVQREVQYIQGGQSQLDKAYGWGMQWAKGSK